MKVLVIYVTVLDSVKIFVIQIKPGSAGADDGFIRQFVHPWLSADRPFHGFTMNAYPIGKEWPSVILLMVRLGNDRMQVVPSFRMICPWLMIVTGGTYPHTHVVPVRGGRDQHVAPPDHVPYNTLMYYGGIMRSYFVTV